MTRQPCGTPQEYGSCWWADLGQPDSMGLLLLSTHAPVIVAVDPKFGRLTGRAPSELEQSPLGDLCPGYPFLADDAKWQSHAAEVERLQPLRCPAWLRRGGMEGPETARALVRLTARRVAGEHHLVLDVQRIEPASPAERAELAGLPMPACRLDGDGQLIEYNAAAASFLDYPLDAERRAYAPRLPRSATNRAGKPLRHSELPWSRALEGQPASNPVTLGFSQGNGKTRWALVGAAREEPGSGRTVLVTLVHVTEEPGTLNALAETDRELRRTLTSVNHLQDQLARSEHMASMGLMAAGLAHEINNPLSYIMSNLSFAAARAIDRETRLALREAIDGASRMRDIVRDLKTLSRMDRDDDAIPVDVCNAVDSALKLALDEVRHKAKLKRHFSQVPSVLGDETRLVQVMLNLVTNAAHSIEIGAPTENQITVEVGHDRAHEVFIAVRDTGSGIPGSHLSKVFEPFFTTKPAGQGTGLGLFLCHRLVDGMGGRISVTSDPGKGACFTVYLRVAGPASSEAIPSERTPVSRRLRLLVVDDERLVARAVQRMFKNDYHVEAALGGDQALERLAAEDFDVVLCDVMMPEISGLDVYRRIRAINPMQAQRFVFATGGLFSQELSDSVKRLSNIIVEKPFEPEELRRIIEQVAALGREPSSPADDP